MRTTCLSRFLSLSFLSYQAAAGLEELVGLLEGLGAVFAVKGGFHVERRVVRLQLHALMRYLQHKRGIRRERGGHGGLENG